MVLALRARVRNGRLVLDEPVDLPDGTEIDLVPADEGDNLDPEARARLHAALARAAEQFAQGEGIAASEALNRLRARAER